MRTKRLFVLIHIRNKGEVGTIKLVLALQKTIGLFLGLSSLALLYVMFFFCHSPMWCPASGVVLGCIDSLSLLSYLLYLLMN